MGRQLLNNIFERELSKLFVRGVNQIKVKLKTIKIMPNWTCQRVTIEGNRENLQKIYDAIAVTPEWREQVKKRNEGLSPEFVCEVPKDAVIDFNRLIPTPTDICQIPIGSEESEKYGDKTWLEWNTENWGTKWNAHESKLEFQGDNLQLDFWTAWSVAEPYLYELSQLCAKHECTFIGVFADEDFGGGMGRLSSEKNGAFFCDYYQEDDEIYEEVWGNTP